MSGFDENLIKITTCKSLGELPELLTFNDGTPVRTAADWPKRRAEIHESAVTMQYGSMPPKPEFLDVEPMHLGGRGKFNSFRIVTGTKASPVQFTMMVRLPQKEGKLPAVITGDLCFPYAFDKEYLNAFSDNDIALVLFNRTELVPDLKTDPPRQGPLYRTYPDHTFGALGAWAWGYHRCVDALEKLDIVDMSCIAFTGHSRGGKTAGLAGATDERAAIVNPNGSGAGGFGCYRLHTSEITEDGDEKPSETLKDLLRNFIFWMGPQMPDYVDCEEKLPFDTHFTKALIAPRTLLITEAASDAWANPYGSYVTTMAAKPVFDLLGCGENLLWHCRTGYHFQNLEDIAALVNVVRHVKWGEPLKEDYFKTPFKKPE